MAGRPPKPTELLLLQGADKKNPKRFVARAGEPTSTRGIGDPPPHFMIQEPDMGYQKAGKLRALWQECLQMWPYLKFAHRHTVEEICVLKLKARNDTITQTERNTLRVLTNSVGGDPSGSARLGIISTAAATPAADPRDSFLKRKSG